MSTRWLKCQHGELAGIGFVPMMVSFVGRTHLVCRAGGNPQGYSPHQATSLMRVFSMERSGPCQGETTLTLLNKGKEDCSRLSRWGENSTQKQIGTSGDLQPVGRARDRIEDYIE